MVVQTTTPYVATEYAYYGDPQVAVRGLRRALFDELENVTGIRYMHDTTDPIAFVTTAWVHSYACPSQRPLAQMLSTYVPVRSVVPLTNKPRIRVVLFFGMGALVWGVVAFAYCFHTRRGLNITPFIPTSRRATQPNRGTTFLS
jgi:hypothetical protein